MLQFVNVTLRNFKSVGTVCPSSPALCKALARGVHSASGAKRVLEVGPGTGPVTRYILKALRPGDHLDLVELSPEFCRDLQRKVLDPFVAAHPRIAVTLHQALVEDAPLPESTYDYIVCGLPFNNFPAPLVRRIMDRFMTLLKPSGELAYFGYAGIRTVKAAMVGAEGRKNLRAIGHLETEMLRRHSGHRQVVLVNIPPAAVMRLRKS